MKNETFGYFLSTILFIVLIYIIILIIKKQRKTRLSNISKEVTSKILKLLNSKIEEKTLNIKSYDFENNMFNEIFIMECIKNKVISIYDFETQKLIVKLVGNQLSVEEMYNLEKILSNFLENQKSVR